MSFTLRQSFELLALLLKTEMSRFPVARWGEQNAPGFEYDKRKANAGDGPGAILLDETVAEDGFLTPWCMRALDTDIAQVVGMLFSGDQTLWSAAERFPRIKGKLDLALEFLHEVDPRLTRDHFERLAPPPTQLN